MRGSIIEEAVMKTASIMKNYRHFGANETLYTEELEEE